VPGINGIVQVAAGGNFSFAIGGNGTIYAWGLNSSGQLGDGTTVSHDSPEAVPALAGVSRLIAGDQTSYAIRPDGKLLSWGSSSGGLLGRGASQGFSATPAVVPGLTGVTQVASSAVATLVVADPGATMWSWGPNAGGESGDGTTSLHATPVKTSLTGVARVAVGRGPRLVQQPLRLLHVRAFRAQIQDITRRLRADRRGVPQILPQMRHVTLQRLER
jgi:alpha-tubulin suppressor-like RCC1 family protein